MKIIIPVLLLIFSLLFASSTAQGVLEAKKSFADKPMILEYTIPAAGATVELAFNETFNVTVNWGDGSFVQVYTNTGTTPEHTFAETSLATTYTITVSAGTGFHPHLTSYGRYDREDPLPGIEYLTTITHFGDLGIINFSDGFAQASNLADVPNILPSSAVNLSGMFRYCSNFNDSDIGSWNTSAVTDMSYMFYSAKKFNQNIGNWNTASVQNMTYMFSYAEAFDQPIGTWNTSAVTNMSWMFRKAVTFNQDIGNWNTSAVTDMSWMFRETDAFNQDIRSWTTSTVENMRGLFYNAKAFNQNIDIWDTRSVTNMRQMFYGATAFNQDIGDWNTFNVSNMSNMFYGATVFNQDIGDWNTDAVTDMSYMFGYAEVFNQDIGDWSTAAVTDMSYMFFNAKKFNQDISEWNTAAVTSMWGMFADNRAFNQDISSWDMAAVTSIDYMFAFYSPFNQDISDWNTSSVITMTNVFFRNSAFDQDLSNWSIKSCKNMTNMFTSSGLSVINYDNILIGWAAQAPNIQNGVRLDSPAKYTSAALTARTHLRSTYNWTINDGGPAVITTWTGGVSAAWETAGNWNNGVPDNSTEAVIPTGTLFSPEITTAATSASLELESSTTVDIKTSDSQRGTLTLGNLTVTSGGTLTVESNENGTAALLVTGVSTGNITAQRFLSANNYHFISAPLNTGSTSMKTTKNTLGADYLGLTPTDAYDAFFSWDETDVSGQGKWSDLLHQLNNNKPRMDSEGFTLGEGYCYSDGSSDNTGQDNTAVFVGELNGEDVTFSASYNPAAGRGYHTVGNPFSAPLLIKSTDPNTSCFLNDNQEKLNSNYMAAYIWAENSAASGLWIDNYQIICNTGFTGVGSGSLLSQICIDVGQGFMVRVKENTSLVFSRDAQTTASSEFFKTTNEETWAGVQLFAASENVETSTLIGFNQNMSAALEPSYDVANMMANEGANIYTTIADNENPFAVQALSTEAVSVNCGITVTDAAVYSFSIYQELMENVVLEDRETGEMYDLMAGDICKIYLGEGRYDDRFVLHFKSSNGIDDLDENLTGTIYAADEAIYLNEINGEVSIYDISGRLIKKTSSNGSLTRVPMQVADGVYIVKTEQTSVKVVL